MIEELLREKIIIKEEYNETIIEIDNRIKILSKNMFIIYANFYKQIFIITNPYYKYNIELNMKYIIFDIIYKCIEELKINTINLSNNLFNENNYEIYKSNEDNGTIINIKYFENKYLLIEYYKSINIIEKIPIGKQNLLEILLYIYNNEVYKIIKNLYF
jgi:hypothetical protein